MISLVPYQLSDDDDGDEDEDDDADAEREEGKGRNGRSSPGQTRRPTPTAVATPSVESAAATPPIPREGDWMCCVYIELPSSSVTGLTTLFQEINAFVRSRIAQEKDGRGGLLQLRSLVPSESDPPPPSSSPLHISLTRPITVRAHERADFLQAVRCSLEPARSSSGAASAAAALAPFRIAFSTLEVLSNDTGRRQFLTAHVSSGWAELRELSERLDGPLSDFFKGKRYYNERKFHVSFAFLDDDVDHDRGGATGGRGDRAGRRWLEQQVMPHVKATFEARLRREPAFLVRKVAVRIGGRVSVIPLG